MQPRDKIGKAVWSICQTCKDVVSSNIVQAARDGQIKLDDTQQQLVVNLINASIDQAFHRSYNNFLKSVDVVVSEVKLDASVPPM